MKTIVLLLVSALASPAALGQTLYQPQPGWFVGLSNLYFTASSDPGLELGLGAVGGYAGKRWTVEGLLYGQTRHTYKRQVLDGFPIVPRPFRETDNRLYSLGTRVRYLDSLGHSGLRWQAYGSYRYLGQPNAAGSNRVLNAHDWEGGLSLHTRPLNLFRERVRLWPGAGTYFQLTSLTNRVKTPMNDGLNAFLDNWDLHSGTTVGVQGFAAIGLRVSKRTNKYLIYELMGRLPVNQPTSPAHFWSWGFRYPL